MGMIGANLWVTLLKVMKAIIGTLTKADGLQNLII